MFRKLSLVRSSVTLFSKSGNDVQHPLNGPNVVVSNFGSGDRTVAKLAECEEEKRIARQQKHFEDLLVFQGGALADHDSFGDRLIMRDFVHYAMYHRKWGFYPKLFRKYRELTTSGFFDPVPFGSLRSQHDYQVYVSKIHETTPSFVTPTQLFQPYYGWALAEYLVGVMRAKYDPSEPLVVYEFGCGTGVLALNILDFLAQHYPDIYDKCEFHLIEQNPALVQLIRNRMIHHYHHVKIHNISALNWRELEPRRCVVLGLELLSSMPHDSVVWNGDGTCAEAWFEFAQKDNLSSCYDRLLELRDPVILRYLRYLNWMQEDSFHHLKVLCLTGGRENISPSRWGTFEPNQQDPLYLIATKMAVMNSPFRTAWIPTASMLMLEVVAQYFPRHHCFFADWSSVQSGIAGFNGPICQYKMRLAKDFYARRATETLNSNAGMVDICFPTNFSDFQTVYRGICGEHKEISNMPHPEFWKTFGGEKTSLYTTKSGYNPLLEDFKQFQVFATQHPAES